MNEWQEIKEHPVKKGEEQPDEVLLWKKDVGVALGFVHHFPDGDIFTVSNGYHGFQFTHWSPINTPDGEK